VVDFVRGAEVVAFAGAVVELVGDGVAGFLGEVIEAGAFGEVLADEAVGVFVGAAFPSLVRVGEVDLGAESALERAVRAYLDGKLAGPFEAECIRERRTSPLKMGERVTVTGILDDDEAAGSLSEMQVEIEWQSRKLGVPLAQLSCLGVSGETAEAIADWHYWVTQGRQF
jgi:hypothetical protein